MESKNYVDLLCLHRSSDCRGWNVLKVTTTIYLNQDSLIIHRFSDDKFDFSRSLFHAELQLLSISCLSSFIIMQEASEI
jgi:hypothetical protein